MENLDKEGFEAYFSEERNWTVVLSDGSVISLKPEGTDKYVTHADVKEYCQLVKKHRMQESQKQVRTQIEFLCHIQKIIWMLWFYIGRASLAIVFRDVARFTVLPPCLVQ